MRAVWYGCNDDGKTKKVAKTEESFLENWHCYTTVEERQRWGHLQHAFSGALTDILSDKLWYLQINRNVICTKCSYERWVDFRSQILNSKVRSPAPVVTRLPSWKTVHLGNRMSQIVTCFRFLCWKITRNERSIKLSTLCKLKNSWMAIVLRGEFTWLGFVFDQLISDKAHLAKHFILYWMAKLKSVSSKKDSFEPWLAETTLAKWLSSTRLLSGNTYPM